MERQFGANEAMTSRIFRFGEFEIDLDEETLRREGEKLYIKYRVFQVLRLLVERRGEVVTKNEFFDKVWGGSFVEDNNLTVAITGLRKALGDNARQARFIENVPRKGYRFIAQVECAGEPAAAYPILSAKTATADETTARPTGYRAVRSSRLLIGLLFVFVIAASAVVVGGRKILWPSDVPVADRIDSVAVLPFEDRTSGNEYLADGLTDSIISNLSKQPGLHVIDRNSAYSYKNKISDLATTGRELNVRTVVTGHIEQSGDTFIISAELIDLASKTKLWRQQFRRERTELYATQLEISRAIIQGLRFESSAGRSDEKEKREARDPKAYDLYLKGRYYWNKRTNSDFQTSAELFKSAIDQDPTFAQAYVGLADAYTLGGFPMPNLSTAEKNAFIRGNIQKALEIDDSLGEAYAASAINKCYYDWDFAGAETDYRRAIELNPNSATAHHWYAEFLAMQGRFDESFAEYDRAISLDPLSLPIKTDRALNYYYTGDFDTAIELLNKVKELNPEYPRTYQFLTYAYYEKAMFDEAVDSTDKIITNQYQRGERSAQDYERFEKYLTELKNGAKNGGRDGFWLVTLAAEAVPIPPYNTAAAYSKLGNSDKAFEYLENAFRERDSGLVWLKVTPEFDGVRSDPRYQDLLRRVGLSK